MFLNLDYQHTDFFVIDIIDYSVAFLYTRGLDFFHFFKVFSAAFEYSTAYIIGHQRIAAFPAEFCTPSILLERILFWLY
jgi:hypothetical protein